MPELINLDVLELDSSGKKLDSRFNNRLIKALIENIPPQIKADLKINRILDKRIYTRLSVSAKSGLIELLKTTFDRIDGVRNIDKAKLDIGEYAAFGAIRVLHATAVGTSDANLAIAQYTPNASAQRTDADVTGNAIPIGAIAAAELEIYTNKQVIYKGTIADFMVASGSSAIGDGKGVIELNKVPVIGPDEQIHIELRAGATNFLSNSAIQVDLIGVATAIG